MRRIVPLLAFSAVVAFLAAPLLAEPFHGLMAGAAVSVPRFDLFGPDFVLSWWNSSSPRGCALEVAAIFASVFCASALAVLGPSQAEDGGSLGNARIKAGREAVLGSDTWDGESEPSGRGYVYGFSKGRYLFEAGSPHCFTCGATGSGKTRFQNIPTLDLLTYGEGGCNVVVSDVKNELVELCGAAVAERGYSVMLLDTQRPTRGHRYNPLQLIADFADSGDMRSAEQAAEDLAAALIPDEDTGKSSHWTSSARGILVAAVLLVVLSEECPREEKHLASVCRVINEGTEGPGDDPAARLKGLIRALPSGHPSRAFASQFMSSGGSELRSVLSTLKVHLRIFSSEAVAWLTSSNDIDPRAVLTEKTALFLHVMDEGSPYNALFSVLFDQIYKAVYLVADENGGKIPRQVVILGDEWGNLPAVRSLPSLLSLGRSYGLRWFGSVQNIAQLNKYGERDGRKKILANCGVKVALKLGESEDRQYFTELVGKTTRHTRGTSRSEGPQSRSVSTSLGEHADDLIRPWEWTTMCPDKDGAIVVKSAENGVGKAHAGVFKAPLTDCTNMPTKAHFGLGTREHEAEKRRGYQALLDERAASAQERVSAWCPEWPRRDAEEFDADDWSSYDRD